MWEDPYIKLSEENDRSTKGISDYVYALRDIPFEVKQREILDLIYYDCRENDEFNYKVD